MKSCRRVEKIEREYYDREQTLYDDIDRMVINLQEDSSSSSDTSSESDVIAQNFGASSSHDMDLDISGVEYLDEDLLD